MEQFLRCPCVVKSTLTRTGEGFRCDQEDCWHHKDGNHFRENSGTPILISDRNCDTVCDPDSDQSPVSRARQTRLRRRLKKYLSGESSVTKSNCERFVQELLAKNESPRVLIIGSGTIGVGTEKLDQNTSISKIGIDIYNSETVDYVADAHYLPFADGTFDGVWIQVVLEHVVEPTVVVSEIHRVLKPAGLVYAETPFMQQVHEGAYDFTRYTVLGHRYLFKNFDMLDCGANKGVGIAYTWSVRYFVWALTRSRSFARVFSIPFGMLFRALEKLADRRSLYDASSEVYFLGTKGERKITHKELVKLYQGFQKS